MIESHKRYFIGCAGGINSASRSLATCEEPIGLNSQRSDPQTHMVVFILETMRQEFGGSNVTASEAP